MKNEFFLIDGEEYNALDNSISILKEGEIGVYFKNSDYPIHFISPGDYFNFESFISINKKLYTYKSSKSSIVLSYPFDKDNKSNIIKNNRDFLFSFFLNFKKYTNYFNLFIKKLEEFYITIKSFEIKIKLLLHYMQTDSHKHLTFNISEKEFKIYTKNEIILDNHFFKKKIDKNLFELHFLSKKVEEMRKYKEEDFIDLIIKKTKIENKAIKFFNVVFSEIYTILTKYKTKIEDNLNFLFNIEDGIYNIILGKTPYQKHNILIEQLEYIKSFLNSNLLIKGVYKITTNSISKIDLKKYGYSSLEAIAESIDKNFFKDLINKNFINEELKKNEFILFFLNKQKKKFKEYSQKMESDEINSINKSFFSIYKNLFLELYSNIKKINISLELFLNFGILKHYVCQDTLNFFISINIKNFFRFTHNYDHFQFFYLSEWFRAIIFGQADPSMLTTGVAYMQFINSKKGKQYVIKKKKSILNYKTIRENLKTDIENKLDSILKFEIEFDTISSLIKNLSLKNNFIFPNLNSLNYEVINKTALIKDRVRNHINEIRQIDFTLFCRELLFKYPDGSSGIFHVEILPNIIFLPIVGNKIIFSDIPSKFERSKLLIPIFFTGNIKIKLLEALAIFRWDAFKIDKGILWLDFEKGGFTGKFNNYVSVKKKGSMASIKQRKFIQDLMRKTGGNVKKIFAIYYEKWILLESSGRPILDPNLRKVFMKYIPFAKSYRETLKKNPNYQNAINIYNKETKDKLNILKRKIKINYNKEIKISKNEDTFPYPISNYFNILNG